jgi:site-specific recombinase XerD
VLETFLGRLTEHSRRAYEADLAAFAVYVELDDVQAAVRFFFSASHQEINSLVDKWMQNGSASSVKVRRLSVLRSLAKAGRKAGLVEWSIDVDSPRVRHVDDT